MVPSSTAQMKARTSACCSPGMATCWASSCAFPEPTIYAPTSMSADRCSYTTLALPASTTLSENSRRPCARSTFFVGLDLHRWKTHRGQRHQSDRNRQLGRMTATRASRLPAVIEWVEAAANQTKKLVPEVARCPPFLHNSRCALLMGAWSPASSSVNVRRRDGFGRPTNVRSGRSRKSSRRSGVAPRSSDVRAPRWTAAFVVDFDGFILACSR